MWLSADYKYSFVLQNLYLVSTLAVTFPLPPHFPWSSCHPLALPPDPPPTLPIVIPEPEQPTRICHYVGKRNFFSPARGNWLRWIDGSPFFRGQQEHCRGNISPSYDGLTDDGEGGREGGAMALLDTSSVGLGQMLQCEAPSQNVQSWVNHTWPNYIP